MKLSKELVLQLGVECDGRGRELGVIVAATGGGDRAIAAVTFAVNAALFVIFSLMYFKFSWTKTSLSVYKSY